MAKTNGDVVKAEAVKPEEIKEKTFYEKEENLVKLCEFLRSNEGPAVREAVEMDKRVYYLKGRHLKIYYHAFRCSASNNESIFSIL